MSRLVTILMLLVATPAVAQDNAVTKKHYANAAEKLLNDPTCLFDSTAADDAIQQDVTRKRQQDREQVRSELQKERSPRAIGYAANAKSLSGAVPIHKPRKRYNRPATSLMLPPFMAAQYRAGLRLATSPWRWP